MRHVRKLATFMLVAGVGLASATGVAAQQGPEVPEAEPIEVTHELLERFTAVYPEVMGVAQSAQAALAAAESAEDAQAIQAEAQQRIARVLDEGDMTAAEYEAVVTRLNADEELRAEFQEMLEEHLAEREDG
jgi:hypothetical protein